MRFKNYIREGVDVVQLAINWAKKAHKGQKRKCGGDYFNHPLSVANIVEKYYPNNRDMVAVAILHDTIEDTSTNYRDLVYRFGKKIADDVYALTNDRKQIDFLGKPDYMIKKMRKMTDEQLFIKLADRLHNVSDLNKTDAKFKQKTTEQTKKILDELQKKRSLNSNHKSLIEQIYKLLG